MSTLVNHTDHNKQAAGGNPMVDHLQDCAFQALIVKQEDTERDKTHMADTGVSDKFLNIGLT